MDAIERIKDDLRKGRLDVERLIELLVKLQRELDAANRRIAELEKKLAGAATTKVDEPFSVRAGMGNGDILLYSCVMRAIVLGCVACHELHELP